ncbi:MAG: hypothetical protein AAGK78_16145, partial [Planctomycetota bacterium]
DNPATTVVVNEAAPTRRSSALGVAGVVLGLLAVFIGLVPFIGLVMIVPAIFAIAFGTLGFTFATIGSKTKKTAPALAVVLGSLGIFVPVASTTITTFAALPWTYSVAVDQLQIEAEYDLKEGGLSDAEARRISGTLGDVLLKYGKASNWREGISLAHRVGRIVEDYDRDVRHLGETARAERTLELRSELAGLANSYDVDLTEDDLDKLSQAFQTLAEQERERHRRWHEQRGTSDNHYLGRSHRTTITSNCR